jgi:pimeloyl-ACP methyl ester carboxylesterase
MPYIITDDGVSLYFEAEGSGETVLFAHEFGGDWRSWRPQVEFFKQRYRCVRYAARGFHPSGVPDDLERYGQARSTADLFAVADAAGLARFHLVGLSMGSYTSLMAALASPHRLLSLTLAGCSSGPTGEVERGRYRADILTEIGLLDTEGGDGAVRWFQEDPAYRRMPQKHPAAWTTYCDNLRAQSVTGARNTMSTLHWNRDSLFEREAELALVDVPTLLVYGDEDHRLIEPTNSFLARTMPRVSSVVLPGTGHLVNIEHPDIFNEALERHLKSARE